MKNLHFPEQGAQYRFQILNEMIPNLLIDNTFESPEEVNKYLEVKIKTIFLQSGDKGTYHNILSGIDCAVWDLFAKSQQKTS